MKLFIYCSFLTLPLSAKTVVKEAPLPSNMPAATISVEVPVADSELVKKWQLESLNRAQIEALVKSCDDKKNQVVDAIAMLTWLVEKQECADLFLEVAARNAEAKNVEAAWYWLQRAARENECDAGEIQSDPRFASLIADTRWQTGKSFLLSCAEIWKSSGFYRDVLTLPSNYDGKKAIPLVLGLHGFGSQPEGFSGDDHQKICNDLNVAFLSVSGSIPIGRNTFMWSASYENDWQHIQQAIKRHGDEVTILHGKISAIGFSQGGQLAADVTASHPEQLCGCIVMSPGSRYGNRFREALEKGGKNSRPQTYFFSWISGEGDGPKIRSNEMVKMLGATKAHAYRHEFPGKSHSFPRGYADYFSIALQVILEGK